MTELIMGIDKGHFKKLYLTGIRFSLAIGGLVASAFTIFYIEMVNDKSPEIFVKVMSYTLGLLISDLNTYTLFQRDYQLEKTGKGFWKSRAIISLVIGLPFGMFTPNLVLQYYIIGSIIGYLLPSGRASSETEMPIVQNGNGIIKILGGIGFYLSERLDISLNLTYLLIIMNSGAYITSIIFIAPKIINDVINVSKQEASSLKKEILNGLSIRLIILPIHFYSSLGGFIYSYFNGIKSLDIYFLVERVIKSLGATVLAIMSKNSNTLSKAAFSRNRIAFLTLKKWGGIYLILGTLIGISFIVLGIPILEVYNFNVEPFDRIYSKFLIVLSVVALYISTLLGTQYLIVKLRYQSLALSSLLATIVLILLSWMNYKAILVISIVEITVTVSMVCSVFLHLNKKNENENLRQN